jgi:hypothetical protein
VNLVLRWVVLIVLLSGAGLLAGRPGTAAYVLSGLTLLAGLLAGAALFAWTRLARRE